MSRILVQMPDSTLSGDLNRDGKITLGELIGSTVAATVLLVVALNVIVQPLGALVFRRWPWHGVGLGLVGLALLLGCALGIWRVLRYEVGYWRWLEDRKRNWRIEDDTLARANGTMDENKAAGFSQADVDGAVWVMLRRWYSQKPFTRESMAGTLSEPLWNAGNKALKDSGLRPGREPKIDTAYQTLTEAWGRYMEWKVSQNAYYMQGGQPIRKNPDDIMSR